MVVGNERLVIRAFSRKALLRLFRPEVRFKQKARVSPVSWS